MQIEQFQLIDRVVELAVADGRVLATATVPQQASIFAGHFPTHPLMPGVLLIESMAQTCGFLLLARSGFARMPFLAEVRRAKLRSFVGPGAVLAVSGSLEHEGSGYAVCHGRIELDGRPVAEAELRFRTMAFPNAELQGLMCRHAAALGVALPAAVPSGP